MAKCWQNNTNSTIHVGWKANRLYGRVRPTIPHTLHENKRYDKCNGNHRQLGRRFILIHHFACCKWLFDVYKKKSQLTLVCARANETRQHRNGSEKANGNSISISFFYFDCLVYEYGELHHFAGSYRWVLRKKLKLKIIENELLFVFRSRKQTKVCESSDLRERGKKRKKRQAYNILFSFTNSWNIKQTKQL